MEGDRYEGKRSDETEGIGRLRGMTCEVLKFPSIKVPLRWGQTETLPIAPIIIVIDRLLG
jgi:hypothetical protein